MSPVPRLPGVISLHIVSKRLTIGLMSENSNYNSESLMVEGIVEAAELEDVNFIYLGYFGINLDSEETRFESDTDANARLMAKFAKLRESIELFELDGLLVIGWSKDMQGSNLAHFREATRGLTVVSLGSPLEGVPSIRVRGYNYLYEVTKHLIDDHGRKRIAFIEPWKHDSRVEGYRAAIRDAGLNSDDITVKYEELAELHVHGARTELAMRILFDERQAAIDAIVVLSATEGKFVLQELQRRGLHVPDDISLVCCEDDISLRFTTVPLTTVYYPYREIGYQGCRTLIRTLHGEQVEAVQIVPTRVIYRNSCGCARTNIRVLNKLNRMLPTDVRPNVPSDFDSRELSDLFRASILSGCYSPFLDKFRRTMLETRLPPERDPRILEGELIEHFVAGMLPAVQADSQLRSRVQELCSHIRDIIEIKEKSMTFNRIEQEQLVQHALSHIGKKLQSSYDLQAVLRHLNNFMGWLQVPSLYLFQSSDQRSGLVFGFQDYYNLTWKFPDNADRKTVYRQYRAMRHKRFTLVILPLHIRSEQIGCAWLDPGRNHARTLVTLSDYIKSAIKGCTLFAESQRLINQLQETKELLESYIQHTHDGVVVIDNTSRILRVNAALMTIFGHEEFELLGRNLSVLNVADWDYEKISQRLASGLDLKDIETIGKHKDGNTIDLYLTISPIQDRSGALSAVALLFRDVTESKKTDEYLRKLDKLSVVGQLAAGLAHEIRNPLTPLRGFTQMLREEASARRPIYDLMLSELDRIDTIVGDFLMVAKPQSSARGRIRLCDLVRSVVKFLEPQSLLHGVELNLNADAESAAAEIMCSDAEIKQVFVNLIKNGIEAMPGGGELSISLAAHPPGHITAMIEDQGVGIPKDKLAMIGEPFYTTKDSGTGLGMMMCYKIVHAHGGQLYIRSEESCGTIVEIVIPLVQPELPPSLLTSTK